jgi:hypothetical protein
MDDEDEGCREEPRERDGEGADGWGKGALCEMSYSKQGCARFRKTSRQKHMGITTNTQNHDWFARHKSV